MQIDPITFEVVKHRLWQINDEQGITIRTISTSPIVVEGNDFNVGLFTKDGDLVVAGPYVLTHVTTMDTVIKQVIEKADEIEDGDMFLVNDPYMGALHQNDVAVVSPLFHEGELVLWIGNVIHHADLAGIDEGSFCINATNVFQESPRYFLKLMRRGKIARDVERTFTMNSRLPDTVALDLRAQIGAINVAKRRLYDLIAERGVETVLATMRLSVDHAERQLRERFSQIPDGSWSTDVFMDGDRVGSDRIYRVHLRLDKRGDELFFDYTGTDPQSLGAVNSTYYACYGASCIPIYIFLCCGEIDWNSSIKRCVHVNAPEGTVVNAKYPAAVSICSIGFNWLANAASINVVAKMLSTSEKFRDRVCPGYSASCNANNIFGLNHKGKFVGALLSDHRGGGAGARSYADGIDNAGVSSSYLSFMSNVESQELKLPVLYAFRKQLMDSGGPGKYRGGLTVLTALAPYRTERLIWKSQNTAGTDQSNALGIDGGYPGAGSQASVIRETRLWEMLRRSEIPLSYEDFGGHVEHLPSKSDGVLTPNDVFIFYPSGGGGYGDPLDRDPQMVRTDVIRGAISVESALRRYGVTLTEGLEVDEEGTRQVRRRRVEERLERTSDGNSNDGGAQHTSQTPTGSAPASGGPIIMSQKGPPISEREAVGYIFSPPSPHSSPCLLPILPQKDASPQESPAVRDPARDAPRTVVKPDPNAQVVGEYLERVKTGDGPSAIRCRRCGHVLCREGEDPREHAHQKVAALGEAGPWLALRWNGQSPHFTLIESTCPSCGVLFDVTQKLNA